jgi:Holliday junction resolvasome RuvABC endonuclease subunit
VGHLLELFHHQLCVLLDRFEPAALVFEAPILVHKSKWSKRNDRLEDVARTLAMCGHVEWLCRSRGIVYESVDLRAIKSELAGFARADKTDMVAAAEKIGLPLPASPKRAREDAADAFGAWLLLLRAKNRSLSARFDSLLWGRRGALL